MTEFNLSFSIEEYFFISGSSIHLASGTCGRSLTEFEQTLINLRKDNFNLKLRIYFLEERMATNFNLDKENAVKKNIELQVSFISIYKFNDLRYSATLHYALNYQIRWINFIILYFILYDNIIWL